MEDWFATWFNSHYYHILYRERDETEARQFIDALVRHLGVPHGSRVLDLACGAGRHALQLRKHGFDVIGIDLSEESIAEAQLEQQDGLEFFVHDMRSLYWTGYFDLVVNLFTSFGYFHNPQDDMSTINSVADSLKDEGIFVLDFMNVEKVIAELVEQEEKTVDGVKFEISRKVEEDVIVKQIHIKDGEAEFDFEERVDALGLPEFEKYFEGAGLELVETFGDYRLNGFEPNTSDRLVMVAKKLVA